ncbi:MULTISPECIES: efflux RND transporter periplasmic adaptor subunit [Burkholderiaceae]|uniref:efflux RND transporter periplasmic adaptor subunit n=1 Tax=Burkholderia sp. LMG 13014 TaxID=2709306 RepID=UPI00196420FC|nr:efflux RND transporter periplasmic adaptor subunit [Burkholderia sp. LMG 13014]
MNPRLKAAASCLALIGAAGYAGYRFGVSQGMSAMPGKPETSATAKVSDSDPQTGKKVLYWHDPMVPGQRFDKPGKSPFMDMQLVPVYADGDGSGGGGVSIDSRVTQNLGIRTVEVKAARMGTVLEAPGNVTIDERSIQVIQARTTGFIQQLGVRATLDPVRKGQTLVTLYAPDWVAAQEEYLAVARSPAGVQGDLADAAKARMRQAGMTPGQADAVARSGKLQTGQGISSPLDGVVTEIAVREGMTVSPGMTLFKLADLGQVWVIAEVPEAQARAIAPGQPVTVLATAAPEPMAGKVDAILPDVNPATRTLKVRIVLPNKQRRLVPGMFANVRFDSGDRQDVLQIPSEAVIRTGQRNVVMVDTGAQGYVATEIRTGHESGGMTEVISGLHAGQTVVTSGQFLIDSEANLRGTSDRLVSPASASAPAAAALEHEGTGRIESVNTAGLTISHGPIPSAQWGAMTMDFSAHDAAMLKGLKPGDRIRFRFSLNQDGEATLSSVQPAGAEGAKP